MMNETGETIDRSLSESNSPSNRVRTRWSHGLIAFAVAACMLFSTMTAFVLVPGTGSAEDEWVQIRVGTVLEPDDFNPFSMTTGISYTIAWMMYEMLYTTGPEMEPYPQLAQSYEKSENGTMWTYHLVEDSYWHDGEQVTAHDVAFTFNMILEYPDECALLGGYLKGFKYPVVALDDYTVQVSLEEPKATMLALTVPILPEHLWADVVAADEIKTVDLWDEDFFPGGPVGSGPMELVEYSKTSGFIRLYAHDPYHRLPGIEVDSINVDEILFVIYTNEAAMTTALQAGELDIVDGVPESLWDMILDEPGIDGQAPAALDLTEFGFNCASKELRESEDENGHPNFPKAATNLETTNLSVRQAVTMATNKTMIVDEILRNLAQEADSLIPTATPFWHYYVPEEEKFPFDLDAANELLDQWYSRDDDGDGIRENNTSGAELEFEFYYIRNTQRDELTATKMAEWCEEIGVQMNLNGVAEGTLYNMWFNLEYDCFIWNWQPDVDPAFLLSVLTTDEIPVDSSDITAWSDAFYSNPVYDQLYEDQLTAMDIYDRQAIVHEMQRIAYRDCPYICLWYPSSLVAYRTDDFMNFPDMERYSGSTPDSIWFYFEVEPYVEGANQPPYDVDAGEDVDLYVGDDYTFTGSAKDLESDDSELNWTWTINEEGIEMTLYGKSVTYLFEEVGVAYVTLTVRDPEGLSASDMMEVTVNEIPEEGVGWLRGYVVDADDVPIAEATVNIVGSESHDDTGPLGFYNMTVVPGTYDIEVSADGYASETASATITKDNVTWLNLTLDATAGSVSGFVYDSGTGEPIANALVELFLADEVNASYSKKTALNGSFTMPIVEAGTYTLIVTKSGYETNDTVEITVAAGDAKTVDVNMAPVDDEGSSSLAVMAGAAIALIAALVAAMLLMRRKKGGGSPAEEEAPPYDEPAEPEEPTS